MIIIINSINKWNFNKKIKSFKMKFNKNNIKKIMIINNKILLIKINCFKIKTFIKIKNSRFKIVKFSKLICKTEV